MLTKAQVERLVTFHDPTFKDRHPDCQFLHGLVRGLDHPEDGYVTTSQDLTTYHALVKHPTTIPLKDLITGKDLTALVDRVDSSYPEPIEAFMQKWFPGWTW